MKGRHKIWGLWFLDVLDKDLGFACIELGRWMAIEGLALGALSETWEERRRRLFDDAFMAL